MSYCRWSCDRGLSDVYVYQGATYTIHVAYRHPWIPSPPMSRGLYYDKNREIQIRSKIYRSFWRPIDKIWRWAHNLSARKIKYPYAGETFECDTPGGCADRLYILRCIGYHVPDGVIEMLDEEQQELDSSSGGDRSSIVER